MSEILTERVEGILQIQFNGPENKNALGATLPKRRPNFSKTKAAS